MGYLFYSKWSGKKNRTFDIRFIVKWGGKIDKVALLSTKS